MADAPFDARRDAAVLRHLRTAAIAKLGSGGAGRSLGFTVSFEDGRRAYFKPAQGDRGAHHFAEIAAFHVDRVLGTCRVAPVTGYRMAQARLEAVAGADPRFARLHRDARGRVPGALIAWIDDGLGEVPVTRAWLSCLRKEPWPGSWPFKGLPRHRGGFAGCESLGNMLYAISDMIVFDYLIANVDRWSANLANVRRRGESGPLLFFDHGEAFWPGTFIARTEAQLRFNQRITGSMRAALETFDVEALAQRLAEDPLAPVLTPEHLESLSLRLVAAQAHR